MDNKESEYKTVEAEKTIFLHASAEEYARSALKLVKHMVNERGMGGVYITVSKPFVYSIEVMQNNGIGTENLFFIDCISQMGGGGGIELENCVFTSPIALSEIMMHANDMLKKVKTKNKFILLDCISTLLVYNNEKPVKEFAMWLLANVRANKDVTGILVTIKEDTPPTLVGLLKAMCEKVIEE
ncbi:MAG: hypothetical protein A7316_04590 [Candidatus Altiarchaeales archaeon WOR_SM1_86-2]|nr:MAG: hypothetical protein A7316_04590 [Candidatus Altiarchaeales archaeon WOR_SM1_86-2]